MSIWETLSTTTEPILRNLDPSLFQNIVLAVLAIFIPFAIVFLSDLLGSRENRSEFEKMVLSDEILGTKKVFWFSIFGVVIFAFFSGTDISILRKWIAIIIALILILFFWNPFKRILRYSEGYKPEFELSFLKGLNLSKIFNFGNKLRVERMIRTWNSFWSEKSTYNELRYTKAFIRHVDDVIYVKKSAEAILLAQSYQKNIEKRDRFQIGYEILPKIFEWNERFWEAQQIWLTKVEVQDKLQRDTLFKSFSILKKWILKIYKKISSEDEYFWNWHYFNSELFPAAVKVLLYDGQGAFQFFDKFKKYIESAESRLEKIDDEKQKDRWWNYIVAIFSSFCSVFFENIAKIPGRYELWEHYFPSDWRVTIANSKKRVPRVILYEFLQWSPKRIFKKNDDDYDQDLSEVVDGIFPNAHHSLFPAFLMLLVSSEIKYAIQKRPSFYLTNTGISWSGEKSNEEIQQMSSQRDLSQKEETIAIIFEYFGHWSFLKLYKDDITEEEFTNWNQYSEEQRKVIIDRVRKTKLQKALEELNNPEIIALCSDSEESEYQRKVFIELLQLLLDKVKRD